MDYTLQFILVLFTLSCLSASSITIGNSSESTVSFNAAFFPFKQLPFPIERLTEEPSKVEQLEKLIFEVKSFFNRSSDNESKRNSASLHYETDSYVYDILKRMLDVISFQEVSFLSSLALRSKNC